LSILSKNQRIALPVLVIASEARDLSRVAFLYLSMTMRRCR